MDAVKLRAVAVENPALCAELLAKLSSAATSDPKVLLDTLAVASGTLSVLGFARAHTGLVASLAGSLLAHPNVLSELLAAVEG